MTVSRTQPRLKRNLTLKLLTWFAQHGRDLPWRHTRDPYAIWVSEIMLQQTQVKTVIPYYEAWLARFPTVQALAEAPLGAVLKQWEGLGYYTRARNLHAAAQRVVAEHDGRLPEEAAALRRLPGIGAYTSGSIASIAFGRDEPAVDGNVLRVLARVYAVREDVRSPAVHSQLEALARAHLPPGRAGEFNEALMDLGATICIPRAPQCLICPLNRLCEARRLGLQNEIPLRIRRMPVPHYDVTAGVIWESGRVLIAQRPADKLLGGLWEFPGGKREEGETLEACLGRELTEELAIDVEIVRPLTQVEHGFTHFAITLHVFVCRFAGGTPQTLQVADFKWVHPADLGHYALGAADRRVAEFVVSGEAAVANRG